MNFDLEKISGKYSGVLNFDYKIKHWFEQYRVCAPFSWNDNVMPPWLFPTCGINTIGLFCNRWSIFNTPGNIVYFATGDLPATITCVSAVGTAYSYLLRQGFTAGQMVGVWYGGGALTDAGKIFRIGTINGQEYWFVPQGFSMTFSTIPALMAIPGNYVWAKALGYGATARLGMAINTWDGSYRHGVVTSASYMNLESIEPVLMPVFCYRMGDWRFNGALSPTSFYDNSSSKFVGDMQSLQLFSVVLPYREYLSGDTYPSTSIAQFDGLLITPTDNSSLLSTPLILNVA